MGKASGITHLAQSKCHCWNDPYTDLSIKRIISLMSAGKQCCTAQGGSGDCTNNTLGVPDSQTEASMTPIHGAAGTSPAHSAPSSELSVLSPPPLRLGCPSLKRAHIRPNKHLSRLWGGLQSRLDSMHWQQQLVSMRKRP
jgi:hypothetical protein